MRFDKFAENTYKAIDEFLPVYDMSSMQQALDLLKLDDPADDDKVIEEVLAAAKKVDNKNSYYMAIMMFISKRFLKTNYPDMEDNTEINIEALMEYIRDRVDKYPELKEASEAFTKEL